MLREGGGCRYLAHFGVIGLQERFWGTLLLPAKSHSPLDKVVAQSCNLVVVRVALGHRGPQSMSGGLCGRQRQSRLEMWSRSDRSHDTPVLQEAEPDAPRNQTQSGTAFASCQPDKWYYLGTLEPSSDSSEQT